jgi:endo-1,4-beta-D-glucanase Y
MNARNLYLSALASLALGIVASGCAQPSAGGPTCSAGQMACSGTCANVATDNQNCGSCGMVCGTGRTCQAGACKCGAGLLDCGGQCVQSNSSNCGSCGMTCPGTQVCNNGACSNSCTPPLMQCSGGTCANVQTDMANCGSCGMACTGGSMCTNGTCACTVQGQMLCGGTCVDTRTNPTHCGNCNTPCNGTCSNGTCMATTGVGGQSGSGPGGAGGSGPAGAGGSGPAGAAGGMAGRGGAGGSGPAGGGGSGPAGTTGTGGARTCAIMPLPGATAADVISDFEEGYGVMIPQGGRDGFWYTYSDGVSGQNQTPTKPPATMADRIPVSPGGVCAMNEFRSSATGHPMYVGFGATFKPARPLTDPPNTMKAKYDASAYDGIVFRARTNGTPTSQPVYVEVVSAETQPAADGGSATVQQIDLYNTRGQMVTISNSAYSTFYVPFSTLVPRWLPAAGANACPANAGMGAVPKCQAPRFVAASTFGLQFSFYDTPGFPKPSPAGSYNLAIDDVAFYKRSALPAGTSDLPALPTTAGAMKPFPQNTAINARCKKAQVNGAAADGRFVALAYKNWKDRFVVADSGGFKVIRPEAGNDTVSEGIAYGMLIAVYMNDKALFDGLWTYWKTKCAVGSGGSCLMTWCIPSGGGSCTASGGTATDADEDAAFAMLMASRQWSGGSYAADATALINAVYAADMSTGAPYIWGGSNFKNNNDPRNNASYYAPAFYRAFAAAPGVSNAAAWTTLANNSYTQLNAANAISSMGLISAWCNQGCTASEQVATANDRIYQYDSHRIPWRIGMDYCWYGTSDAQTYVNKTTAFFMTNANANGQYGMGRIADLYNTNGTAASGAAVNSASIIGTAAAGAMASSHAMAQTFVNDGYQLVMDLLNRGRLNELGDGTMSAYSYYNATVGMLMLLTMSGNMTLF